MISLIFFKPTGTTSPITNQEKEDPKPDFTQEKKLKPHKEFDKDLGLQDNF